MRHLSLGSIVAVLLSASLAGDEFAHFKITKQRSADEVTVSKENGVTVFSVASSNGIGWAKFENEKAWPMKVLLRLTYKNGRKWERLEGFSLYTSRATVSNPLAGTLEVRTLNEQGREALDDLSPQELSERVGFPVKIVGDAVEIELPMSWLATESEFMVRWIDQYRN